MSEVDILEVWRRDPVVFAEDVFGARLWSGQKNLIRAIANNDRVAIRSGHKCGKTFAVAIVAWWWTQTQHQGEVILVAPTWSQLKNQVWKEIRDLYKVGLSRGYNFGGCRLYTNPNEGVRWSDGSASIFGFSADTKHPEKRAGYSGRLLYLIDEASGVHDGIHEIASTSPDGRVAMISNPTRTEGAFYDAFHGQAAVWKCLHLSSEDAARENQWLDKAQRWQYSTANVKWVSAMREKYGADSYFFDVRVRGVFSRNSNNTVMSMAEVKPALDRWRPDGWMDHLDKPLHIGVDVARFGDDDTVIVWRRGPWASAPITIHGADNVQVAERVTQLVVQERRMGEKPVVKIDVCNNAGVADILNHGSIPMEVVEVNSSDVARHEYDEGTGARCARLREVLWLRGREWLRNGGSIPADSRTTAELTAVKYDFDPGGAYKIESKRELKKRIGRSTDAADALLLAAYEPSQAIGAWD